MAKWVYNQDTGGGTLDYPELGFRAPVGAILSATGAPDGRWSLNGDQGAAETVTRYTIGGDSDYIEPTDGHVLAWSDVDNAYVPTAPELIDYPSLDDAAADYITNPVSASTVALQALYVPRFRASTAYAAGATVLAPDGTLVKAKVSFTSGASYNATNWTSTIGYTGTQAQTEADARYAKADGSTAAYVPRATLTLPNPCYIAHRFGAGYAPEETMEAGRTSIAAGVDAIEADCQPLADGSLGLMHDATVDRTTDGTGTVASFTAPAFRALNAAAKFPWNGKVVPPALLTEALNEFGGNVVFMIEPKDVTNATQIMDLCDRQALKGSVILATSTQTTLQAIKARGYVAYFYWATTTTSPALASIVSDGADYLGIDGTSAGASDATITAMVATGRPVIPYTINRRVEKTRLLGLGCKGFLGDQSVYLKATTAQRTVDSWRQGVYGHGLLAAQSTNTSISGTSLQIVAGSATAVIPGEVCPIANAAGTYSIDIDCGFVTIPADTTRAISISFGVADDAEKSHSGAASSFPNEYRAYLRANGQMSLYRVPAGDGSVFTQLGSTVNGSALTAGGYAHLKITVTPTNVTLARTDGTAVSIGPIADATYRGGYFHLSKNTTAEVAQLKNLAIT